MLTMREEHADSRVFTARARVHHRVCVRAR
jgi:hypothetical protein